METKVRQPISGDVQTIPLEAVISFLNTMQCDIERGTADISIEAVKALYTATFVSKSNLNQDIWESDGTIYIRSKNKSGDDVVTEITMRRKAMLVAAFILRHGCASTFQLSSFFTGNNPNQGVREAIMDLNKAINPYGFFAETFKKGVYRIVKN